MNYRNTACKVIYLGLLLGLLGWSSAGFAQQGTVTVVGTVQDPSGAVIPNATVNLTRTATNQVFATKTTGSGDFTISNLTPGDYSIKVTKKGFKTFDRSNMDLEVARTYRVDATLAVGEQTQTVQVRGGAPILQTESAENAQVIHESQIVDLPTNSRDVTQFMALVPGVMPPRGHINSSLNYGDVEGMRQTDNQFIMDGTEAEGGNGLGTFTPNLDALSALEVKTGLYGAEYGNRPGAQIITVTKSGTNQLHGDVFDFLRNNHLDARNFFQPGPNPQFKRNLFGGTIGGPIVFPALFNGKNKAWFFFAYQGQRQRRGVALTGNVPTADQRNGIFDHTITDPTTGLPFSNNTIPQNSISPIAQKFMNLFPTPNTSGAFNYTSPASSNNLDTNQIITRIDVATSPTDRWYGRFIWDSTPVSFTNAINIFSRVDPLKTWSQVFDNTRTFGTRVVNDFNASFYRRPYFPGSTVSVGSSFVQSLGIQNFPVTPIDQTGVPQVGIPGYLTLGDGHFHGPVNLGNWSVKDDVSITSGAHSFKAGYQWLRYYNNWNLGGRTRFNFDSRFTGDPLASFLLGIPVSVTTGGEVLRQDNHETSQFFYFQDHWRATKKLTLDLGIRYALRLPWIDKRGFASNINPATGDFSPPVQNLTLQSWQTGRFEANVPYVSFSKAGIFPRFGFAYLLTPKTVIRGGYGMYGNRPVIGLIQWLAQNPRPNAQTETFQSDVTMPTLTFENPFSGPTAAGGTPTRYGMQTPLPVPVTHHWGVSLQREVTSRMVFKIGYIGARSYHQVEPIMWNDATPGPGSLQSRRPLPNLQTVAFTTASATNDVNGMEVSFERRAGPDGLSFLASYSWIRELDTAGARLAIVADPVYRSRNVSSRQNRGPGEANIPGRFVLTSGYALPFGSGKPYLTTGWAGKIVGNWNLQGILSWAAGPWDTISMSYDAVGVGSTASQRPDQLMNPALSSTSLAEWFNTAAFATPPQYTYGNAGRGTMQGPGFTNLDFGIIRDFSLGEQRRLEFRGEFFNAFNHPQFGQPDTSYGTPSFGAIGSALTAREIQVGMKIYF